MKYLLLLFLVSCATTKPNCEEIERDTILGTTFSILKCNKPRVSPTAECGKDIDRSGKYTCIERGYWWKYEI